MFKIIHVSDLHLRAGWHEEQGLILRAFFDDLNNQDIKYDRDFFVFSGDLLQSGSSETFAQEFEREFASRLDKLVAKKNRIFCPGNHDIDRDHVEKHLVQLLPIAERMDAETLFNTNISQDPLRSIIRPKFDPILKFAPKIFGITLPPDDFEGHGYSLTDKFSIYVLNSALYSFGGAEDEHGSEIDDEKKLRVETRKLYRWLENDTAPFRALVMHHPFSWLVNWAREEIAKVCRQSFDLVLQGHEHEPDSHTRTRGRQSLIIANAPALHTLKAEKDLGYAIIAVDVPTRSVDIHYRQWTAKDGTFVTGSTMSGTDDGTLRYTLGRDIAVPKTIDAGTDPVADRLKSELDTDLGAYKSLSKTMVPPRLSKTSEYERAAKGDDIFTSEQLLSSSSRAMIYAPQLFGLTTLGRLMSLNFWTTDKKLLIYTKLEALPGHTEGIEKFITAELERYGIAQSQFAGVVLDTSDAYAKNDFRRVNGIHKLFPDKRIYMLNRLPAAEEIFNENKAATGFEFDVYHLRSMHREGVRVLVKAEIESGTDFDEDHITQRVTDDVETLNIHRTPMHAKTLLAIAKRQLDNSPVNRTEMLVQFLHIVFQNNVNLRYDTVPDLKDSAYALGFFCASLLKQEVRHFTKQTFMEQMTAYCKQKAVDLDVGVIFSVLVNERILINYLDRYIFNYTYWIYLFAAHHMYADEEFREMVLRDRKYAEFPEVIEFYSGLDRHRTELLNRLTLDLAQLREDFEKRSQIPRHASIHDHMRWKTDEDPSKVQGNFAKFLNQTELPTSVKDDIADRNYDHSKPYGQELRKLADKGSFGTALHAMTAAARALRNSDHVAKEEKAALLGEILLVWKRLVQMATILAPDILKDQEAQFEDVVFVATRFPRTNDAEADLLKFHTQLPGNAARMFHTDLTTKRMGPLLELALQTEKDQTLGYFLALQILLSKPKGWMDALSKYIASLDRNSFFLATIGADAEHDYRFGFNSSESRVGLRDLMARILARHELKMENPNKRTVQQISAKLAEKLKE